MSPSEKKPEKPAKAEKAAKPVKAKKPATKPAVKAKAAPAVPVAEKAAAPKPATVAAGQPVSVNVFDIEGRKTSSRQLPESVFNVKAHPVIIAQAVRYYRIRSRAGTASTKDRSQVHGSGKKIYAQKHTGRARHADRQAVQFVGGGRAHGAKPHRASVHFPHQQRHLALRAVLSDRLRNGHLQILSLPPMDQPSAKAFRVLPQRAGWPEGKNLYVFEPEATNAYLSVRNIPDTDGRRALSLTAYDVLRFRNVVLTEKAAEILASRLKN